MESRLSFPSLPLQEDCRQDRLGESRGSQEHEDGQGLVLCWTYGGWVDCALPRAWILGVWPGNWARGPVRVNRLSPKHCRPSFLTSIFCTGEILLMELHWCIDLGTLTWSTRASAPNKTWAPDIASRRSYPLFSHLNCSGSRPASILW